MSDLTPAELTDVVYAHLARIGRALASPHRLVLLDLLSQGEKTVETLAERANFSVKNASAHLRALREARLVATRKAGTYVFYRLADPSVARFLHAMVALGRARLADVDLVARTHFEAADEPTPIAPPELYRQLTDGAAVTVLDLRTPDEHATAHVPGARSIPSRTLDAALDTPDAELPLQGAVVVYCRSAYCTHGLDAVRSLTRRGLDARRLAGGFAGWQQHDLPTEPA